MLGLITVLTQCDDERKEFVVAYASRSNNATKSRYSSYEGECLATVWAVAHFRCYHSYDILGARMLWKPKEARILKNLKKNYRSTSVIW
jgi:hypothetical protein